jgi:lysophospholipase
MGGRLFRQRSIAALSFVAFFWSALLAATPAAKFKSQIKADWRSGYDLLQNAGTSYFTRTGDKDKLKIAYSVVKKENSDKVIVLVPGFAESPYKYSELIFNLWDDGYSIAAISLRGMGLSSRYPKPSDMEKDLHTQTVHIRAASEYAADLQTFIETIVDVQFPEQAKYIFGHSTGGFAAADYLATAKKSSIKAAVLNSPLFRLPISTFNYIVLGTGSLLFSSQWPPYPLRETFDPKAATFAENTDTNDETRWDIYNQFLTDNTQLIQGPPSRNWIQAVQTATSEKELKRIAKGLAIPVLLLQAGQDKYVDIAGQNDLLKHHKSANLKNVTLKKLPTAYHSIWRGKDFEEVHELILKHLK